jgi:hypothetical protein
MELATEFTTEFTTEMATEMSMELATDPETFKKTIYESFSKKLSNDNWLYNYCHHIGNGHLSIDARAVKHILMNQENMEQMLQQMLQQFNYALSTTNKSQFVVHLSLKSLSIHDAERYYTFIQYCCQVFKNTYPHHLEACIIYHEPIVFTTIYKIISIFIPKETRKRIQLYKK